MATFKTNLSDKELLQTQEMSHDLWGGGKSLDERVSKLKERLDYANGSLLSMCGIVDDKGAVVTSMKQYYSKLLFNNQELNAVGLGAIFTNEKHRKAGWAKKLISMVLEEAKEEGYNCAYLFSDIGDKYYSPFGFTLLPSVDFISSVDFLPSSTALEAREATKKDSEEIVSLFQKRWPSDLLHLNRDSLYWDFYKDLNTNAPAVLLSTKGKTVGYLTFSVVEDKLWLDECIIDSALENEALGYLRVFMEKNKLKTLQGWHHAQLFSSLKRELVPRKKSNPMVYFFEGAPAGWTPQKSWIGSLDHF